jgi:hypothetical protein
MYEKKQGSKNGALWNAMLNLSPIGKRNIFLLNRGAHLYLSYGVIGFFH